MNKKIIAVIAITSLLLSACGSSAETDKSVTNSVADSDVVSDTDTSSEAELIKQQVADLATITINDKTISVQDMKLTDFFAETGLDWKMGSISSADEFYGLGLSMNGGDGTTTFVMVKSDDQLITEPRSSDEDLYYIDAIRSTDFFDEDNYHVVYAGGIQVGMSEDEVVALLGEGDESDFSTRVYSQDGVRLVVDCFGGEVDSITLYTARDFEWHKEDEPEEPDFSAPMDLSDINFAEIFINDEPVDLRAMFVTDFTEPFGLEYISYAGAQLGNFVGRGFGIPDENGSFTGTILFLQMINADGEIVDSQTYKSSEAWSYLLDAIEINANDVEDDMSISFYGGITPGMTEDEVYDIIGEGEYNGSRMVWENDTARFEIDFSFHEAERIFVFLKPSVQ